MKKTDKPKKKQKLQGRTPKQRKGVTELTDQDLKGVQGGAWVDYFDKENLKTQS